VHEPSVRVLRSIAQALDLPAGHVLAQAGLVDEDGTAAPGTEAAILADPHLSDEQKLALVSVYRSYRRASDDAPPPVADSG
jgi:hypothetical protein